MKGAVVVGIGGVIVIERPVHFGELALRSTGSGFIDELLVSSFRGLHDGRKLHEMDAFRSWKTRVEGCERPKLALGTPLFHEHRSERGERANQ